VFDVGGAVEFAIGGGGNACGCAEETDDTGGKAGCEGGADNGALLLTGGVVGGWLLLIEGPNDELLDIGGPDRLFAKGGIAFDIGGAGGKLLDNGGPAPKLLVIGGGAEDMLFDIGGPLGELLPIGGPRFG
jgi:hypothetical protein